MPSNYIYAGLRPRPLREFWVLFWGVVLEVFANGICVSTVQNTSPELLRIGSILSVHLCVCVSVCSTFWKLFFGPVLSRIQLQFHEKSAKNGFCNRFP